MARPIFAFWLLALLLSLAGCAAPGEPEVPRPRIPEVIGDLAAQQLGEQVILSWTPPTLETSGARLEQAPHYEVYRTFVRDAAPTPQEFSGAAVVVLTLPANLAETFLEAGQIHLPDPVGGETIAQHAGELAVYAVKSLNPKGQSAGFSKLASVRIFPPLPPPRALRAEVRENAIEFSWEAPAPAPAASLAGYRILRSPSGEKGTFVRVGSAPASPFRDTDFEFGKTYFYRLRTLAQFGAEVVESKDSETLRVAPVDRFPPRAPTGLVAIAVPGAMELSWNPNSERDLAGYQIYRRANSEPFRRINAQMALTPTFRDASAERGKRYTYAVTAVDASGNESGRSAEVSEDAQ